MMFRLYRYIISADNGKTWTAQYLTDREAEEMKMEFPNWIIMLTSREKYFRDIEC